MDDVTYSFFQSWFNKQKKNKEDIRKKYISNSEGSVSQRMKNVLGLYKQIWKEMQPEVRRMYIYDEYAYDKICKRVEDFLNNKIKIVGNDQSIFIDDIQISKNEEDYDKYFKGSQSNFKFIVTKMLNELKGLISLTDEESDNINKGSIPSFIKEYIVS